VIQKVIGALRLGRYEAVRSDLPVLEAAAAEDQAPDLQMRALQWLCRARAALDGAVDAQLMQRLVRIGESGDEVSLGADAKVSALLALADAHLRAGRPRDAQRWAERASESTNASRASPSTQAWARHLQGAALLTQGRAEPALAALKQAQDAYEAALGRDHPRVLASALNQAVALEAMGRREEAREIVAHARPFLRDSLGDDAPTFQLLLQLERRLDVDLPIGTRGDVPVSATSPLSPLFL
jgi:tetratricopeptide (TPR) repeat protein